MLADLNNNVSRETIYEGKKFMRKQVWIGVNDKRDEIIYADETSKQVKELSELELSNEVKYDLSKTNSGFFGYIISDREMRKNNAMADRPPFAIATIEDGVIIRIECYQGHNSLSLILDLGEKGKPSYEE